MDYLIMGGIVFLIYLVNKNRSHGSNDSGESPGGGSGGGVDRPE